MKNILKEVRFLEGDDKLKFEDFPQGSLAYVTSEQIGTSGMYYVRDASLQKSAMVHIGNDVEYTGREFKREDLWKTGTVKLWQILKDGEHSECYRITNTSLAGAVVQVYQVTADHYSMTTPPNYPLDDCKAIALVDQPPKQIEELMFRPVPIFGQFAGADFEFVGKRPISRTILKREASAHAKAVNQHDAR